MSSKLKGFLDERGLDGLLFVGDSLCDMDLYYLSRFLSTDRFTLLATDRLTILVSSMERGRAALESKSDEVVSTSDYDIKEKLRSVENPVLAYAQVLKELLLDRGVERLGVPGSFPAELFVSLSQELQVSVIESPVRDWRAVKGPKELEAIRAVQGACEEAMRAAVTLIGRSEPRGEHLFVGGEPLTSERVRAVVDVALLERGCEAVDTIVAGGRASVNPHSRGSGPLPPNAPIVIDIFPRSKESRYFADMTRTVLKGEAPIEITEMYEAVLQAQLAGLDGIRDGATGKEVHSKVCDAFKEMGYSEGEEEGFIHSTGHGVGLAVHEKPSLSEIGERLVANNVVTVEPGLYYPQLGGVRLEDLVVVKGDGCENLTRYEQRLVI